ncbi:MAG TPA: L-rhamnose/proton symporter RhaT, partial [Acidobacteriaceae bacterium]|nr:L-rhamnose/proton symporter RhaT [Acidobacteriaceae bacterium]
MLGVIFHWLGGLASASCYLPFRGIRRWSWETYWLLQGVFSWILAPLLIAAALVPNLSVVLHTAPWSSIFFSYFWGCMWGFGALTFGLSIRYLGIALGYPIALGLCTVFGTLMPPIFQGEMGTIVHQTSGQFILLGIAICVLGIIFSGLAGRSKEQELSTEEKKKTVGEFHYGRGLAVSIFAGVMSACFAYGLASGKPIAQIAKYTLIRQHRSQLWQNLPVLVVVLLGGFTTNFFWCLILLVRNRSASQYVGIPAEMEAPIDAPSDAASAVPPPVQEDFRSHPAGSPTKMSAKLSFAVLSLNYAFSAVAGITWYFQFFFYSMGQTKMGKYDFSSWTLHMASIIIFSTIWGIAIHEWRGTSFRTRSLVAVGLALLVVSTLVVGYGNYLQANGSS